MGFFFIFRFVFFALFTGLHCALMFGLIREWRWDRKFRFDSGGRFSGTPQDHGEGAPRVSVIVPVHNEALRLKGLLSSLALQDYSECEYIFIDDRSDDESAAMLAGFAAGTKNRRVITLTENPGSNHKQYALGRGIAEASGELFLFTDADCEVPPCWIRAMVNRMADGGVGAVIGPVFRKPGKKGFFHFYQCIDHGIRYMYLAGSTGIGAAGGGFGNNLILRKDSLEAIGGYGAIPESPTEDATLVSRIRSRSKYHVHSAMGADTHVFTGHEASWGGLLNQTLRWNNGGLFSHDLMTRINFGYLMIAISIGILAIPLLIPFPRLWPLPAAVVIAMILNTAGLLLPFRPSLPPFSTGYFFQLLFTPAWMTLLTILGICGHKVEWKGSPAGH